MAGVRAGRAALAAWALLALVAATAAGVTVGLLSPGATTPRRVPPWRPELPARGRALPRARPRR